MSSWVALNVEPDEAVEEEVDDTKELQIEEALKLYHSALKLHAQGPEFYSQAAEAYEALLNSEIFKYPESISDFKGGAFEDAQTQETSDGIAEPIGEFNVNDSTSSLFQTLYLSYKNHGKYVLDAVQESIRTAPKTPESEKESQKKLTEASRKALQSFGDALERDDSDLNLWRQSARLSSTLQSHRLSRYCLESVLADDDNRLELRPEQLGLEEIFAEQRLRSTLEALLDKLSASQIPVKRPKKALLKYLKQHEDPYPNLPAMPANLRDIDSSKAPLAIHTSIRYITPAALTWESVGKALLHALDEDDEASLSAVPSRSIGIVLPTRGSEAPGSPTAKLEDVEMTMEDDGHEKATEENEVDAETLQTTEQETRAEDPEPEPEQTKEPAEPVEESTSIDQSAEKQLMESLERQSAQPPDQQAENDETNAEDLDPNSAAAARKRSSASAANEEPEGGRMKSRRTRARESNADALVVPEEIAFDQEKYYENRLEIFVNADDWMFSTIDSLFSKVGTEALGGIASIRAKCSTSESTDTPEDVETRLFQDLRGIIKTWDDEKSRLMQQKDELSPLKKDIHGTSKSGLAVFLEHSRKGARKPIVAEDLPAGEHLYDFSDSINSEWRHPHDTSFHWVKCLLMPNFGRETPDWSTAQSAYRRFLWPKELKSTLVDLLLREDEFIYKRSAKLIADLESRILDASSDAPFEYKARDFFELEMIQSLYELHLDIFASIETLGNKTMLTRLSQSDKLSRWGMLARSAVDHFVENGPSGDCQKDITLRHLWTSAFHVNLAGEAEREHILLCLQDLKQILQTLGNPDTNLINNSTMSELSAAVIDQEVLKLKCMDFFAKVFNSDSEDPVSLIEAIEPILEPSSIEYAESFENDTNRPTSHLSEMAAFLDRGDATLRLFLWRRLLEAYQAIDYPPKVVSCYLRSIEVVMTELEAAKHSEETSRHRQVSLLSWLKALDGIMAKAIPLVLEESDKAYECLDQEHLQTSMSAVSRLTRLLHSFVLFEDSVRVGQTSGRDLRASLTKSLENFKDRMRELYVRCWILQYTLFLEAIAQNKELFDDALEDRIHFLRSVHNALGVRSMCRYSQRKFLKLLKAELFDLETKGDYEFDVCQILYDLHGIKFSPFDGTMDHGCPSEKLDRPTAIMMIDFVLQQANKMNMKDLSKSELKTTIEKMQTAIGIAKATSSQTPQLIFNRRIINAYLKAALNPSNLLRAVQGITELSTTVVPTENAKIAAKGWFFLLGHAALTKFRSQKRLSPGSTSELDDAISFFRQDLEHGSGRWETWFRLAQAYDSKLDEDITWTADKINNSRADLATLQRNAIHCYAMAVSTAIRTAEPTAETRALMSDLYSDFGIRLYSSSREPLSMGAFSVEGFPRHFSSEESQQMYKGQPFKEMSEYSVWNFASNLLKRAAVDKSKRWMTHYTLGKCLWKMYNSDDSLRTSPKRVEMQEVLDALFDAINALPQRRDSRSDPIFEPHFKLFSFVHKLVLRGKMTPTEGSKALLATPWAKKVDVPENMDAWNSYMMEVLRKFKSADKSNWHHRMGVKAAHLVYDGQPNPAAAIAAKHELSQIFTKTLTIQVWRPEFERPGRHFVYTTRYVYFFVGLLDQLDDRASLDQLLRRLRKKQGDFLNHTTLWEDSCLKYAKLIRRAANINEGHEDGVFKPIGWEEFSTKTARMESLPKLSPESQPLLELLREALELKKLNNNLMKVTMFEDLIADLYARVYEVNMPLLVEQVNDENKEKMNLTHLLMTGEASAETSTPPTPLPTSDTPAPRGRTKGIARRDIQKRADTIVNTKLARRAPANQLTAPGENDPPSTPHGASMPGVVSTPAGGGTGKQPPASGDGAAGQKGQHDSADESDVGEGEDQTMLDEGNSTLFPAVTDAEEGGTGDEGADEGDGEDNEDEGEEGNGDDDGEEDEETQDEEAKGNLTAEQSANETETEPSAGKAVASKGDPDAMEITLIE
ncbi:hypothetical protein PENANT_c002G02060 [Penicillium antarcticum]|uniref:Histone transcription regulator 3 homolog n=1 Tax=Penicillium antarcticum TaxID=416450 RepID=A0A1V6QJT2_9EURO|nr:uncharacterized protein N7508_008570 [Penicillium antarcticum]KAJ5293749.1 hypothetical protein N7508_008570 [Penicillium antarcticum]OQD89509.1 hypothetical protein PENANT_c002G02060 [Penicillium antarcticum]